MRRHPRTTEPGVLARLSGWALTSSIGALGLLAAHCAGYQLIAAARAPEHHAGGHTHAGGLAHGAVSHDHLIPVASGAFLVFILAGLAVCAVAARRSVLPQLRFGALVAIQVAGYTTLEFAERAANGDLVTIASAEVLAGLLFQAPIAYLLFRLCRRGLRVVARLLASRGLPPRRRERQVRTALPAPTFRIDLHWALSAARRGPPQVLHSVI